MSKVSRQKNTQPIRSKEVATAIPKPASPSRDWEFHSKMLEHTIESQKQEIAHLRALAYVPSEVSFVEPETWQAQALSLKIQLEQLEPNASKVLDIQWLSDSHDCETCGSAWEEGALVSLNGTPLLDMSPVAHCYNGRGYDSTQVYEAILKHLGYSLTRHPAEDPSD